MKIVVCKKAGFCMGVRRAMNMALDLANLEDCPVYTHGPLIHNPQVVDLLKHKGVTPITAENDSHELHDKYDDSVVLIRAHGVPPGTKEKLIESGYRVVDGTCPKVIAVQNIIAKASKKGDLIVIVGDHGHPEVVGLLGFAAASAIVVSNEDELKNIPEHSSITVVSQTTNSESHFKKITEKILKKNKSAKIFNTICRSTHDRQAEVISLSTKVDAMVVVGGKNSGNTKRLAEVASDSGKPVFLVETAEELEDIDFSNFETVGVTAGASTPNWLITRVVMTLSEMGEKRRPVLERLSRKTMRFLSDSNLLIAAGAGSLSIAFQSMQGITPPSRRLAAIALLYIFSMHVLHRFLDSESFSLNEPHRSAFYTRYRFLFLPLTVLSMIASLYFAFIADIGAGVLLSCAVIMGVVYKFKVFPMPSRHGWRIRSLESLPASKTLFISLAWATVVSLLPTLNHDLPVISLSTIGSFLLAGLMVFMRQLFFDLRDVQGDRVVGKETLPIFFGPRFAEIILLYSPLPAMLISLAGYSAGVFSLSALVITLASTSGWLYLWLHHRKKAFSDLRYEIIVDAVFLGIAPLVLLIDYLEPALIFQAF